MAHFAELDNNNYVLRVVVISNDDILEDGQESEAKGIALCEELFDGGTWLQTSYNDSIRGKYAAIGDYYDEELDEFV